MALSSDSEDDLPLTKRSDYTKRVSKSKPISLASDSDDDLPDWVKEHKSPNAAPISRKHSDSDDNSAADLKAGPSKRQACPSPAAQLPMEEVSDVKTEAVQASTEEAVQATMAEELKSPTEAVGKVETEAGATALAGLSPVVKPGTAGKSRKKGTTPAEGAGPSQPTDGAAVAGTSPQKLAIAVTSLPGEVILMLPEKIHRNKMLIEVTGTDDNPSTDLAGDAGAVGRVIVMGGKTANEDSELHLDLKGVLYKCEVLPLSGCVMVINIGATEAKVESLVSDYVRLRQESAFELMGAEAEGAPGADMMMMGVDSDDENYQMQDEDAGEDGEKKKPKKKGSSKDKGGAKGTGRGTKPKASKGIAKKPAGAKKKPAKRSGK